MKLLSIGNDVKTVKGESLGYRTAIMYLAPASLSGMNICPWSTEGCRAACLYTAGRGMQNGVQQARLARTMFYRNDRAGFLNQLIDEIQAHVRSCQRAGVQAVVRLNGTSDIDWQSWGIIPECKGAIFYDYTKSTARCIKWLTSRPETAHGRGGYHLTLSSSEVDRKLALRFLRAGGTLAVVFRLERWQGMPTEFSHKEITEGESFNVIDGDLHDLRFLDMPGSIVGLRAKGRARHDQSGFVVPLS